MAKLIDKDTVVAEIKRLAEVGRTNVNVFEEYRKEKAVWLQQADVCDRILSFINTLKVKEVDLQKEIDKEWEKCNPIDEGMGVESAYIHIEAFDMIAKHFFELGLKAKG